MLIKETEKGEKKKSCGKGVGEKEEKNGIKGEGRGELRKNNRSVSLWLLMFLSVKLLCVCVCVFSSITLSCQLLVCLTLDKAQVSLETE